MSACRSRECSATGAIRSGSVLAALALVSIAILAIPAILLEPPQSATAGEADLECEWQLLPPQLPARYMAAGVFDPEDSRFYYYGGLDANGAASADVHYVDLSDADPSAAVSAPAPIEGQQPDPRWGHAGVYRSNEADAGIYWIGGQRGDRFEPTPTATRPRTPRPTATNTPKPT